MKKCLLSLIYISSLVCKGQDKINTSNPGALYSSEILTDNSRKDFSTLDFFYLIAKSINPVSTIIPNKDTLLVVFDMPPWLKLPDSLILAYAKTYFDALSIQLKKNSAKFKWYAIQVCNDPSHCGTAWYQSSSLKFKNYSFLQKAQLFFQTNYHHSLVTSEDKANGKQALVVRYYLDTTYDYTQFKYIQSFNQATSAVILDLVHKSSKTVREKYDELITLFFDKENHLLYFWRLPVTDEQLSKLYKIKFYETSRKFNSTLKLR